MNDTVDIFEYLEELRNSGMPEDIISRRINAFLQEKARKTDTPYRGHFELTPLCNLNCKMCYVHLNNEQLKGRKLLSRREWTDIIAQSIDAGMVKATLSGGECLTYPWFDDIFLFLKSKGISTTVLTNGVLLDHQRIRFFQKHRPRRIQISLYGSNDSVYEEVTGKRCFSSVFSNLLAAKEADLPIKISITPSKYMLRDFKNLLDLIKDIDIPYAINLGLMTPRPGTGRENKEHDVSIEDYIDLIYYNRRLNNQNPIIPDNILPPVIADSIYVNEGLKCGAGRSTFSINWLGIMNPCTQMTSIAANPLQEGFTNAWKYINKEVKIFPRFKACDSCTYSYACDFCAAENEKIGSRYVLNSRWCKRAWEMVKSGLRSPSYDSHCDL